MHFGCQNTRFCNAYARDPNAYLSDENNLTRALADNDVKYGAWTLAHEIAPAILSKNNAELLKNASEKLLQAAEFVTHYFLHKENWENEFPWSDEFARLVSHPPGYALNVPCSRIDIFMDDTQLKFIELNTDGCSGMTNTDIFHRLYAEIVQARSQLGLSPEKYSHWQVMPAVLETLCDCYQQFRTNAPHVPEKPHIAILDWEGEETRWEFYAVRDFIQENGYDVSVVSPEQAEYDGKTLRFNGIPVHLIYRRLLGKDYADNMDVLAPVTAAFEDANVCMVGTPRSHIAFTKRFFAHLHSHIIFPLLPQGLQEMVTEHVPWTCHLQDPHPRYCNEPLSLLPFVKENREKFVLKPCDSKCGEGIYQGPFLAQSEWEKAVDECQEKDYIVQEFIPLVEAEFPRFGAEPVREKRYIHIGAYVFGGKFCGVLSRTCGNPLLNVAHGERLLATLVEE